MGVKNGAGRSWPHGRLRSSPKQGRARARAGRSSISLRVVNDTRTLNKFNTRKKTAKSKKWDGTPACSEVLMGMKGQGRQAWIPFVWQGREFWKGGREEGPASDAGGGDSCRGFKLPQRVPGVGEVSADVGDSKQSSVGRGAGSRQGCRAGWRDREE